MRAQTSQEVGTKEDEIINRPAWHERNKQIRREVSAHRRAGICTADSSTVIVSQIYSVSKSTGGRLCHFLCRELCRFLCH
jgi:hypothetical protein